MACTSDTDGAIVTAVRTVLKATGFVAALMAVRANMIRRRKTETAADGEFESELSVPPP